jgi:isopentenyl-diphosphate Delta-isomerase
MSRMVTLVDPTGQPLGEMDVYSAHTAPGFLHLACSAVVFGPDDTVLLQRRADDKPTFGGKWSNTCCTHPYADELPHQAAGRRMREELGFQTPLVPAGSFRYRAVDAITGMVEHELDYVSIGSVDTRNVPFRLDDAEVAEVAFVPVHDLGALSVTPWFQMVFSIALSARES